MKPTWPAKDNVCHSMSAFLRLDCPSCGAPISTESQRVGCSYGAVLVRARLRQRAGGVRAEP